MTFANVVSVVALFVALGGSSYAAITITGKNVKNSSLTGKDIKNSSLTTSDVRNGSLLSSDFKSGQLPRGAQGPQGPQGAQGTQGEAGTAVAYAYLRSNGTFDAARSKNIVSSRLLAPGIMVWCVDVAGTSKNAVGSIVRDSGSARAHISTKVPPNGSSCNANEDLQVVAEDSSTGTILTTNVDAMVNAN